jgi:hypothetical protein
MLLDNPTVQIPCAAEDKFSWVLISDASQLGCGALLFDPHGNVFVYQHKWTGKHVRMHINELEAIAVSLASDHFAPLVGDNPTILFVDNTSVKASVTNGMSRNFFLNILAKVPLRFTAVSLLKSKENPADPLSRYLPLDDNFDWEKFWRFNYGRSTGVEWSKTTTKRVIPSACLATTASVDVNTM